MSTFSSTSAKAEGAGPSAEGAGSGEATPARNPVACIVLGMAGAGKTTLMQRLNAHLHERKTPYYLINLDPAVIDTPFGANIDIRDTVNYREVMRQYQLGPNGGILTALNLFATRFEDVMKLVEARAPSIDYVLIDTPGQIEIFTWSASGSIISESLASTMPTIIVYVIDTPRCASVRRRWLAPARLTPTTCKTPALLARLARVRRPSHARSAVAGDCPRP